MLLNISNSNPKAWIWASSFQNCPSNGAKGSHWIWFIDKILHIQIVRVDKQIGMEGLECFGLYPFWTFILNLLLPNFCCRIGIVKILLSIQVKLHRILVPLGLPLGQWVNIRTYASSNLWTLGFLMAWVSLQAQFGPLLSRLLIYHGIISHRGEVHKVAKEWWVLHSNLARSQDIHHLFQFLSNQPEHHHHRFQWIQWILVGLAHQSEIRELILEERFNQPPGLIVWQICQRIRTGGQQAGCVEVCRAGHILRLLARLFNPPHQFKLHLGQHWILRRLHLAFQPHFTCSWRITGMLVPLLLNQLIVHQQNQPVLLPAQVFYLRCLRECRGCSDGQSLYSVTNFVLHPIKKKKTKLYSTVTCKVRN